MSAGFLAESSKVYVSNFRYAKRATNDRAILDLAIDMNFPPLGICRIILNEKFSKQDVKQMLRDPDLIPDPMLSANVL